MRIPDWMVRQIARTLALTLALSLGGTAAISQQPATPSAQAAPASQGAQGSTDPQSGAQAQGAAPQQAGAQSPTDSSKPVGTAVAPYEKTTGITASRPAGAVIAPAKQRRVRSILIKVGVIAAAGVAIGTVAALSHGSPSQPH